MGLRCKKRFPGRFIVIIRLDVESKLGFDEVLCAKGISKRFLGLRCLWKVSFKIM